MSLPDFATRYDHQVFAIDTGYHLPVHDALYVVIEKQRAALIDTGTSFALPRVEAFLQSQGLNHCSVDWIILTHIHLDHAGGAGAMMAAFPQARLLVHPRGAPHMADPTKLIAATEAVYGSAATKRLYGTILPIDKSRIVETSDGSSYDFAGRSFLTIDSPGHAKHHIAIRDSASGNFFTGDTFGLSYREFDRDGKTFIFPTTTPSQFDPEVLLHSQARIASYQPAALYPTHYGEVRDIPRLEASLAKAIPALAALSHSAYAALGNSKAAHDMLTISMSEFLCTQAQEEGWALGREEWLHRFAMDIDLNAQGLLDYQHRMATKKA